MALETKTTLSTATVNALQDLIQINIDSRDGFQDAAEHLDDFTLASLFRELAAQRIEQASELRALVADNGETPEKQGSVAAAIHRAWMDLRSAFGAGAAAILSEAERGEDHIKAKYESVIKNLSGCAATDVLHHHYAAVKKSHDRIRDLRDEYNA